MRPLSETTMSKRTMRVADGAAWLMLGWIQARLKQKAALTRRLHWTSIRWRAMRSDQNLGRRGIRDLKIRSTCGFHVHLYRRSLHVDQMLPRIVHSLEQGEGEGEGEFLLSAFAPCCQDRAEADTWSPVVLGLEHSPSCFKPPQTCKVRRAEIARAQ